jgi:TolB-like protein
LTSPLDHLAHALQGRYTLERELGAGGMATVYLAEDTRHRRKVALKVLRPELAAALGPDRFLREIEVSARLTHPHVLPLLDSGEANGTLFYVMPYVEGESLRDRLTREKQLPLDDALQIAREVADALSYAHSHGVIHRDIKPDNILIQSGHAVVADFGIARAVDHAGGDRLTETGMTLGTPAYMSPEQASASPDIDGRSDLYSLGCVLYEMLAGQPPFAGPTAGSVVAQHLTAEAPDVTVMRPGVPPWVAEALRRSLAKTPADRFHPVAQFATAIGPRGTTDEAPVTRTARRPRRMAMAVVTVAALATLGGWFVLRGTPAAFSPDADPSVLAVLPFEVRASDQLGYLREGMIDLVSAKLDGVGALRVVDPNATVASVTRSSAGPMTVDQARRVSATLGAGRTLQGSIVQVGEALQIRASVYGPDDDDHIDASVDGPADGLFALVDELVGALVARGLLDQETPLSSLEGLTTNSNDALRLYLEGIQNFRLGRGTQTSFGLLTRAVALDSTFALASYWAGYVAAYDGIENPAPHYQLALRHADRLGQRDRMRLPAAIAAVERRQVDAIRLYEAFVARYPDDLAGWFQLGEQLAHTGHFVGRTVVEARPAYERAIALDPALAPAYYHLSEIAGLQGDTAALRAWGTRLASLGVDSLWIALMDMMRALVDDDTAAARQPFERMRLAESDIPAATFGASIASLFGAPLEYAPRASRALCTEFSVRALTDTTRVVAARGMARVEAAGGRFDAADSALRSVAAGLGTALPQDLAWIALHPANRSRARIQTAARALTAVSPRPGTGEAAAREYLLATLALRLERRDAFAQRRAALERFAAASPDIDRFARDLASELDAMATAADGDPRRALEFLLDAGYWEHAQAWLGFREPTFVDGRLPTRFPMFLRAELLEGAGQDSAAAMWYRVAADDEWYRAPALARMAAIRARHGASDEAAELRRRARALWADADGPLLAARDDMPPPMPVH